MGFSKCYRSKIRIETVNSARYVKFCKLDSVNKYYWSKIGIETVNTARYVTFCKWDSVSIADPKLGSKL